MRLHTRDGEAVEIPPESVDAITAADPGKPWRATIIWRPPRARYPKATAVREPKDLIDAMMARRVSGNSH